MGRVALGGRVGCQKHDTGDVLDLSCEACHKLTRTNGRFLSIISKIFEARDMGAFQSVSLIIEKSNGDVEGMSIGDRNRVYEVMNRVIAADALSHEPSPPIIIGKFADKGTKEKARFSIGDPLNEERRAKRRRVKEKPNKPVFFLQDIAFTFTPVNSFEDLNRLVNRYSRGAA